MPTLEELRKRTLGSITREEIEKQAKEERRLVEQGYELDAAMNDLLRLEKAKADQEIKLALSAKKIADQKEATDKRVETILQGVQFQGSKVGAIDRVGRALTALAPANTLYTGGMAAIKGKSAIEVLSTYVKTYANDVSSEIQSAWTGKEARTSPRKSWENIGTDIFGMPSNNYTKGLGIGMDIITDPFGKVIKTAMPLFQMMGRVSGKLIDLASKAPKIEKGIDAFANQFTAFYEIDKYFAANPGAGYVGDYMKAFRRAVHAGDFSGFKQFGSTTQQAGWLPGIMKGMKDAVVGGGAMPITQQLYYPPQIVNQLSRQFAPTPKPGMIMGVYDWVTNFYKAALGMTPKFWGRNLQDNLIKSAMEPGIRPWDYVNAFKPYFGGTIGGFSKTELQGVGIMSKQGVLGRTGLWNIPGYANALSENLVGRLPIASAQARAGKTINQIAQRVEEVMYQYSDAYFTPLQRMMSRIFPFAKYEMGQAKFYPKALTTNRKWASLYYAKQGTMSERDKMTPWLNPDYLDMYRFGEWGNTGTSLEDFSRKFTANPTAWFGAVNPTLQALFEGITNRKVFQNTSITGDTSGKAYQHLDRFTQALVGFNKETGKTDNNIVKYILEKYLGPSLRFYQDVMNPNVSAANVFFTPRTYDIDNGKRALMHQIDQAGGGKTGWQAFVESFMGLFGNRPAGAEPQPSFGGTGLRAYMPTLPLMDETMRTWVASMGGSTAGMSPQLISMLFNQTPNTFTQADTLRANKWRAELNLGRDMAKIFETETSDVGENWANAFKKNIENLDLQGLLGGKDSPERANNLARLLRQYNTTRPLRQGETRFTQADLQYNVIGNTKLEQAIKDEQTLQRNFINKTAQLIRTASNKNTMEYIDHFVDAEMASLAYQQKTSQTKGFDEYYKKRADAIRYLGKSMEEDLIYKINAANAEIMKNWAEGMSDGNEKMKALREAEIAQFKASEHAKVLLGQKFQESYYMAIEAIRSKWEHKIQEQRAKEAREEAERLVIIFRGQMENTLKSAKNLYERGGMSIEGYYGKRQAALLTRTTGIGGALGEQLREELKPEDIDALEQTLETLKTAPTMDLAISILDAMGQMIADAVKNGRGSTLKLQAIYNQITKAVEEAKNDLVGDEGKRKQDEITMNKTFSEMSKAAYTLTQDVLKRKGAMSPGARFSEGGWAALQLPPVQLAQFAAQQMEQRRTAGMQISGMATGIKASDVLIPGMEEGEDPETYYEKVREKVEKHYEALSELSKEGQNKVLAMKKQYAANDIAIAQTTADKEAFIYDTRYRVASEMSQMLLNLGTTLYETSNQKSREAFVFMKAMAVLNAMIKGKETVLAAYKSGMEVGGPYAIATATAFAGIASAFVGAQIGAILGQAFNPTSGSGPGSPGKAAGGKITSGRGGVDDVPIRAMRDEWVIKAPSARKYGDRFMNALNEGIIDIGAINIPGAANRNWPTGYFAGGGKVTENGGVPIKVEMINRSGQQLEASAGESYFNGQEYLVSVFIDAHNRNVGGLQERFPMRR